jgi:primase-polymerase (primpol)-like protein
MIPELLKSYNHWLGWRYEIRDGKKTKPPIDAKTGKLGSSTDPATWASYETALAGVKRFNLAGLGFALDFERVPIVGVDIDHCIDQDGYLSDLANWIVRTIDSYAQISPSGQGVRIFALGDMPATGRKNTALGVEMYKTGRYLTVTNNHIPTTPADLQFRETEILTVYNEIFGPTAQPEPRPEPRQVDMSDTAILRKAANAKNGQKFIDLWNGNAAAYDSQSEADCALCCLLAFYTGGDENRIDRIFRATKLYRPKWDTVHFSSGATYGRQTINRALQTVKTYYDPMGAK